jgi:hypothetical protein
MTRETLSLAASLMAKAKKGTKARVTPEAAAKYRANLEKARAKRWGKKP